MNRQEILALGIGLLLILGVVGVANTTDKVSIVGSPYEDSSSESSGDGENVGTTENSTANVTISAVRAMRTAQNETRGTAVGIHLKQPGNVTELDRPVQTYEVDVLMSNRSHLLVDIHASNGSVRSVERERNETENPGSLFENETEVPEEQLDPTAIRSSIEAVHLAWNATDRNRTVTEVRLTRHNETLVYDVNLITSEGARRPALVATYPRDGDILVVGDEKEGAETATD